MRQSEPGLVMTTQGASQHRLRQQSRDCSCGEGMARDRAEGRVLQGRCEWRGRAPMRLRWWIASPVEKPLINFRDDSICKLGCGSAAAHIRSQAIATGVHAL